MKGHVLAHGHARQAVQQQVVYTYLALLLCRTPSRLLCELGPVALALGVKHYCLAAELCLLSSRIEGWVWWSLLCMASAQCMQASTTACSFNSCFDQMYYPVSPIATRDIFVGCGGSCMPGLPAVFTSHWMLSILPLVHTLPAAAGDHRTVPGFK